MPRRVISLSDSKSRDAHVEIEPPKRSGGYDYVNADGVRVSTSRIIKSTEDNTFERLLTDHDDDPIKVGQALLDADPEIDLEQSGRVVGPTDRVYIREDGSVLYVARTLQVRYDADGEEIERKDFEDVEATVSEDDTLPWSGRMIPVSDVVRRFALSRTLRLRHVNGLTFDFLREIAQTLEEEGKMLLVGAGKKGRKPLIFQRNGSPYRGFLEGRTSDDGYLLLLHLSNLELKALD